MSVYESGEFSDIYFIEKGITLDADNLTLLQNIFKHMTIKRGMYFLREGEPSTEMAMVIKGLLRSFYIDEKGNDITKYFYAEGSMLFSSMAPLTEYPALFIKISTL